MTPSDRVMSDINNDILNFRKLCTRIIRTHVHSQIHFKFTVFQPYPETPILSLPSHTLGPSRTYWVVHEEGRQKPSESIISRVF